MIQEIIEFTKEIGNEAISPPKGLNMLVDFDEYGNPIIEYGIYISPTKKVEADFLKHDDDFFNNCAQKYPVTGNQVHSNKRFVRQIETNSPYCIGFSFKNEAIVVENDWQENIDIYLKESENYLDKSENIKLKINCYQSFITNSLQNELTNFFLKLESKNEQLDRSNKIKLKRDKDSADKIYCYLNIENKYYEKANTACVTEKAASAKGSNIKFSEVLSVYPGKKPYLYHSTAPFRISYPTSDEVNKTIGDFFNKLGRKQYPKPLPIFIDKNEFGLNEKFITIFEKSGKKKGFKEIIEELFKEGIEEKNIQNYYLLNAYKGKKVVIQDLDFVPQFRYSIGSVSIYNLFNIEEELDELKIKTIFEFHEIVIQELFDKKLSNNNFFGDLNTKAFKYKMNIFRLVQRYRQPIFDFIYKSKIQAISGLAFKDIVTSEIKDAFTNHQRFSNRKLKEERIKKLLNIYFSINHHFDPNNLNFHQSKNFNMAKTTKELIDKIKELIQSKDVHVAEGNNELFAFCTGQLIHYLVSQNQSSKKSHSLLLPYLQKNDFDNLKVKIKDDLKKYSYAINFSNKKFNKLTSEIMGFVPSKNLREMEMFVLAGYFAPNILYSKS